MSITFKIAIADGSGIKGGTIQVDGLDLPPAGWQEGEPPVCNVAFPKGTHAIRWTDADWHWVKNYKTVVNDQIYSDTSPQVKAYWKEQGDPPVKSYTYVGGLLDEPNTVPKFEFPLAGTFSPKMPPTDLVDTLVVEMTEPKDVEFLDKDLKPIHRSPQGPKGVTNRVSH
ncbi:MAG: hypothetical protein ACJ76Y_30245 [Thermoanaerobaculia bacterium]